jgi:hypothetical protein
VVVIGLVTIILPLKTKLCASGTVCVAMVFLQFSG